MSISGMLPYIQIVLSLLLIGGILLQRSEAGLGGAFGGDAFSGNTFVRRGAERTLFRITITLAILFAISTFISLII
jgi:protein translocase SecG subunit